MTDQTTQLTGWGLYPRASCKSSSPSSEAQLNLKDSPCIAMGLGRSYGDAALNNKGSVIQTKRLNRLLTFCPETGVLEAEGGISLEKILNLSVTMGWFLPVTPGTKFATLGGCIAADVHGKNHHVDGSFGNHVIELELLLPDQSMQICTPTQNRELFWATVGGMGLTGIITRATIQLAPIKSGYIYTKLHSTLDIEHTFDVLNQLEEDHQFSVCWTDALAKGKNLGRSVVIQGEHAETPPSFHSHSCPYTIKKRPSFNIPFFFPKKFLNRHLLRGFNQIYYSRQKKKKDPFFTDYNQYFYPLDCIGSWNKLYGKIGFLQYQFVVPLKKGMEAIQTILETFQQNRVPSYLAILKRFGKEGKGLLSFPMEGYTLALDIPRRTPNLFPFLHKIDKLVLEKGGRVYLAKDARLSPEMFQAMYPNFKKWKEIKERIDPEWKFQSDLSRRLQMERL